MPEAQYEDRSGRDLVAHLVVADDDPADLARLIGFQLLADPRIIDQPIRCVGELLDHARRRFGGDRTQMLVQSHKVRRRSEAHTSELQSLMRISYSCLFLEKKK